MVLPDLRPVENLWKEEKLKFIGIFNSLTLSVCVGEWVNKLVQYISQYYN